MATISSPGIGSGIDVQTIVRQLVALEKAPLATLEKQANTIKTRISTSARFPLRCLLWVTRLSSWAMPAAGMRSPPAPPTPAPFP